MDDRNGGSIADYAAPSFNALGRVAMVWGVPLIPLSVVTLISMLLFTAGMVFIGGKAMYFLLLPLPFIAFFKSVSAKDDQALRIIGLEVLWFLRRRNVRIFNGTTTVLSTKFGRDIHAYQRFFAQNPATAAGNGRFSAATCPTRNT